MKPSPSTLIGLLLLGGAAILFFNQQSDRENKQREFGSTARPESPEGKIRPKVFPEGPPEHRYRAAHSWVVESQKNTDRQRLANFQAVRLVLLGIQKETPEWEPERIAFRMRQTNDWIQRLQEREIQKALSENAHLPRAEK
ncbi:hypothetical protein [Roseibacillus persicicus]|uniref:Uncharacterized protein n=1 Tax=Roseibacillus persicicus TaxID=454148 RepID=A0A918WKI6_9BACT|nr:hypothetical protein [Roseibacillus persicicus]GHC54846.1 hypothetical protein GCM10007100_21720 [Roseibacillus persicicus]